MELIILIQVGIMLFYALPGFLLIKSKLIKDDSIPSFAKFLMYVAQPFFTIYAFQKCTFTWESFGMIMLFFVLAMGIECILIFIFYLIFKKKHDDVRYRIYNIACCFGNCLFIGLPLIEAILPDNPEASLYANMFFLAMSLLGWTVASYIISQDTKYIKVKKIFLNPAVISIVIALILYFANIKLPEALNNAVTILGKMSTPLCMIVMGMRLACSSFKDVFCNWRSYIIVIFKQIVMPLFAFALVYFLPIDSTMKITLVILSATPIASVVQTFAEMVGAGQKEGADLVLLGTILSVGTIPLISLFIQFI